MERPFLSHERLTARGATPTAWLFFLHGIYGSGRNWASIARKVVEARPDVGAILVDLREHGASRSFPPPHTLKEAAADLAALRAHLGIPKLSLLGHSFGGKVALAYLRAYPDTLTTLFVVDSTPEALPPGGESWDMLALLRQLPGPFASREELVRSLEEAGLTQAVARWMAMNAEPSGGQYRWRFRLPALEALLADFFASSFWEEVESPRHKVPLHFIKAEGSQVLSEDAASRIEATHRRYPWTQLHRVQGGHWLNVDNPGALISLICQNL